MKASLSWLRDYIDVDVPPDHLADQLTMSGLEVEAMTERYTYLEEVRVARIIQVEPHPQADKLKLCRVDTGERIYQVVCGAPNSAVGLLAPLALPGAVLPAEVRISAGKIRGQISEGMLCSAGELGLGVDRSGLLELDSGLVPGTSLNRALQLSDTLFEIGLTPNRSDCLSILGIAREIAGFSRQPLRRPPIRLPESCGDIRTLTSVRVEAPDHCPRYAACLLDDITVAPSPFWLQDRLMSVGLRPISNLVDITNYILMETGQPLHAFDFDRLAENRIVVRTAFEGEPFTTLDGKERRLAADMLMICDGRQPVAVAGVMGGLNSEIEAHTRRVLIESACFDPVSVRRTSKRLGLNTEASHRFERGVDPWGTLYALERAAQLMAELGGGRLIGGCIDVQNNVPEPPQISLGVAATNRLLGTTLDNRQIGDLLTAIEFGIEPEDDQSLKVTVPSFRVDVSRPEDLMEEVARRHGYDRIQVTFPAIPAGASGTARLWDLRSRMRDLLAGFGFSEAITYSFIPSDACDRLRIGAQDRRRRQIRILNPISDSQAVMRTSLVPGLLETVQRNLAHHSRTVKLFEIGKIFIGSDKDQLPEESEMFAGVWTGNRQEPAWHTKAELCDFYDIKGVVEGLLAGLNIKEVRFMRLPELECTFSLPGRSARLSIGDTPLGIVAEVDPEVLYAFDIKQPLFLFEINLHDLMTHVPDAIQFEPLPRYPYTDRDLTLIVNHGMEAGLMVEQVRRLNAPWVEQVRLFDVFEGAPIPAGLKSVSLRITYRAPDRTLSDEAVNQVQQQITERLIDRFKAELPA
jgi:phenylalanyl-tRNA synthetase beta chain